MNQGLSAPPKKGTVCAGSAAATRTHQVAPTCDHHRWWLVGAPSRRRMAGGRGERGARAGRPDHRPRWAGTRCQPARTASRRRWWPRDHTGPATAAAMAPGRVKKAALHPPAPYDARPRRNGAAMTALPSLGSRLAHLLSTTYATSNRPPLLSGRGARDPWRWRWRGPDRTNFCDLRPIFAPYARKSAS